MTKIMLVEDDNNLREIYEARLSAEGYEIVSAENGEAALAMAAKERPDMIISDVMMPKISGFEMLDILRNTDSLKNTKIIMLTALGQAEDSQRATTLGADRYLVKSQVTLEDIVKATHELLDDPTMASLSGSEPAVAAADPSATPVTVTPAEPAAPAEPTAPAEPAGKPAATATTADADHADDMADTADPVPPVSEPAPSEPSPAPEPEPVTVTAPPVDPAPTDDGQSTAAPASDSVPTEPLTVVPPPATDEPVADPAPSVISIPVSDGTDDATSIDATAVAPATPVSADPAAAPITVVEPPSEPPAPTSEPDVSAAPEAAVPSSETPAAEPAPPQSDMPAVEIPSLVADPDVNPNSEVTSDPITVDGPADPVLSAEQLDSFSAPVISTPDGSAAPAPQEVPVPTEMPAESMPADTAEAAETSPAASIDDQLQDAANDLATSAATESTTAANADGRLKTISPLPADGSRPTIHQLLAVEEAKNSAQQAAGAVAQPGLNVDAYTPAANTAPANPANGGEIDPNSISL